MTSVIVIVHVTFRPSPHGEGGLKYPERKRQQQRLQSLPARGGWIEISALFL